MFRPIATADLSEFPALGTPPNTNRQATMPGRLPTSYASTAGNSNSNSFQHEEDFHSKAINNNSNNFLGSFLPNNSNRMNNNFGDATATMPEHMQSTLSLSSRNNNNSSNAPRSFTMDEFPTLQSAASPFDNAVGGRETGGNPEQWLDYANLREGGQQGKPFSEKTLSESWTQSGPPLPRNNADNVNVKHDESSSTVEGKSTDPYGLLGLLSVIRMTDPDRSMLALGSDLTTLGLDLNTPESIYSTFISPWSDTQSLPGLNVEPGYYLPACYRNVQATPPAHQRMRTFSDEILFYVFYCMPKDIAQETAAQELYSRNWRYHKELGLWLTKEADENGRPVQVFRRTSPNGLDRGIYVFFDPTTWKKVKREWALSWDTIEERPQQPLSQQQGMMSNNNPLSNAAMNTPPLSSSSSNNAIASNRVMM